MIDDAEIRGWLLNQFYNLRQNNGGWVPTDEIILGPHPVSRPAIANACEHLANAGYIRWEPFNPPNEQHTIGRAKIMGPGIDVVTGARAPTIDIRFPDKGAPVKVQSRSEFDAAAAAKSVSIESTAMYVLKESPLITLADGLALLEGHLPAEQAKARLTQALASNVLKEQPRFAFEYDGAEIDWTTGSVKLRRKREPFCPTFLRSDFNDYFFEKSVKAAVTQEVPVTSRKVFVVHGRDNEAKNDVARFLSKIGLEEIILNERPNIGRHLLTKFQDESEGASFAVVLITPDDECGLPGAPLRKRARQNVVFELGFFIGRLGPSRVAALVKGDVEKPSDFDGVGYIDLDPAGGWKRLLARELKAAKIPFDADEALGA